MQKTTSRERMHKLCNKQRMDDNFDPDERQEKERKRIAAIRKRQKLQREQKDNLKENYRLKETEQKRKYRQKNPNRDSASNIMQRNKTTEEKSCRQNIVVKNDEMKILQLKVKVFLNEARRLKRKLDMCEESGDNDDTDSSNSTETEFLTWQQKPSEKEVKMHINYIFKKKH